MLLLSLLSLSDRRNHDRLFFPPFVENAWCGGLSCTLLTHYKQDITAKSWPCTVCSLQPYRASLSLSLIGVLWAKSKGVLSHLLFAGLTFQIVVPKLGVLIVLCSSPCGCGPS